MSHPIALSTMYAQRWPDARDLTPFFDAGRAMGFEAFELSHILSPAAVARVDPSSTPIVAVHHPCPRADDADAAVTDGSAARRAVAERQLRDSIDTCAALGAFAVVVHLGRISDGDGAGRRLSFEVENRYRAGSSRTQAYEAARGRLDGFIARCEPGVVDRALAALEPVVAHASRQGVRLGLETGRDSLELPTPTGMHRLLDAFPRDVVGAWLDTGHVGAQANLGRSTFDDWFDAVGDRWWGVHCHDVVGLRDHLIPGLGSIDFAAVARRIGRVAVVTCEFDYYFAPDEVVAGASVVREAFGRP